MYVCANVIAVRTKTDNSKAECNFYVGLRWISREGCHLVENQELVGEEIESSVDC